MRKVTTVLGVLALAACSPAAFAQDSVSINPGLPGDAVSPYADSAAALGSEQCNNYVVGLCPFETSKGTTFGIAPIIKSAKADPAFFNNLISAQSISRKHVRNVLPANMPAASYQVWTSAGFGVNNDPAINTAPGVFVPQARTNQFGVAYSDFGGPYNGVTGAIVNIDGCNPDRLFVSRRQAANNGCMSGVNLSQIGFGSVDEFGNTAFRADNFGVGAAACGVAPLTGNNVFITDMGARDCDIQNVISTSFPVLFDATTWIVQNSATAHTVPNILPASITNPPIYFGPNFNVQYVRGAANPPAADLSHLAPGVSNQRGAMGWSCDNCQTLASSAGVVGHIGIDAAGDATVINVFGINAAGGVTGRLPIPIPQTIIDECSDPNSLRQNIEGLNEMDHYHSQAPFRGGVAQVAVGADADGRLLVAAEVDHPTDGGPSYFLNYIMVARVDCTNGGLEYTMAGYVGSADPNNPTTVLPDSKKICDANGNVIGQMAPLGAIPGAPTGPSVSGPAIDSAGNVWFLSAIELFDNPGPGQSTFTSGLLRAVYDPVNFCYNLELVFVNRQEFEGKNSGLPYEISFLSIADADSVNSGTLWSQNISDVPHMSNNAILNGPASGQSPSTEMDSRSLGGLVVNAEITYDFDLDGSYDPGAGMDQDYQVLLYVGSVTVNADLDGDGDVDGTDFGLFANCFGGSFNPPSASCSPSVNADFDGDGDVDAGDFALFGQKFTGAQ